MSESEKTFLVRADGQILGPFEKKEVIRLIKQGQISAFSEVAEPFSIYRYLQDHPDFKEVIRSLDVSDRLTHFITKTARRIQTFSQTQKSKTKTRTDTGKLEESTEGGKKELTIEERQSAQEVAYQPVHHKGLPESHSPYQPSEQSEPMIQKKVRTVIQISWKLIIFLALSLTAYIVYQEGLSPLRKKQTIKEDFKSKGLTLYNLGDYTQALPYFEKAYLEDILTDEEKIVFSSLLIQEGHLQKAALRVEGISEGTLLALPKGSLLSGMLSFFQSDFALAEKRFQSAWDSEKDPLALLNLSVLELKRGNPSASSSYLDLLLNTGYERDVVFYLKALNLLRQNQISALISYIKKSLFLGQRSSLLSEYRQELDLMLAYSYMKEQKLEDMRQAIQSLLNRDPFFERESQYSSFTIIKSWGWREFLPYCQSLFNFAPQESLLNALNGFCSLKAGDFEKGGTYIEQAKNREPESPLFLSLYAYFLILQEKNLQAEQALSLVNYDSDRKEPLPFILKAHLFERKGDWAKALSVWRELLSFFPNHLSGQAGVAICSYKLKDNSTADIFSERVLSRYPYHKSLLFLEKTNNL